MHVTCVYVEVKPECVPDFINECIKNHNASTQEPGNLRFDVLQDSENPAKFMLYEGYQSDEAAAAHKNTQHYKEWRAAVENMMAKPRVGIRHKIICPKEIEKW